MRFNTKTFYTGLVALAIVGLVAFGSFVPSTFQASGAVITPVSNNNSNGGARFALFNSGTPVTADTRNCIELGSYDVADWEYVVTQIGSNETTVTQQYSNNASGTGFTNGNFVTGATLHSGTPVAAATPVVGMVQHGLFGRYTCTYIDVTNATPISVYISAVAK